MPVAARNADGGSDGEHKYWLWVYPEYDPNIAHSMIVWLHPPDKNSKDELDGWADLWDEYCRKDGLPPQRLLAHPGGDATIQRRSASEGGDCALAVGPEGGFTDDEVAVARASGWRVVGLGLRILRIETAAIALAVQASLR